MKKLINLIALVMLVSVNVLTPFSYADVEDFVDNVESIENDVENVEEYEETLPVVEEIINDNEPQGLSGENEIFEDSQSTTSGNVLDEEIEDDGEIIQPLEALTESGAEENNLDGGESIDEEENIEELELQKVQDSTTMQVISGTSATLLPGTEFNSLIKTLANDGVVVAYTGVNDNVESFQRVDKIPEGVTTGEISLAGEQYPVYAGFSGGILYYMTQAETIYMNPDSSFMFYHMGGLTGLDASNFDTNIVESMAYMFGYCGSLIELDLSGWNTSNVTDMVWMFVSCYNLVSLNLDGWDTSNVVNMGYMFDGCSKLQKLDLSSFDTSKVTNMTYMFYACQNLETIYASMKFIVTNVSTPNSMFYIYNSTKLVGGNGTKFNSSYVDKEYAVIDKPGRPGYFTDPEEIMVKFMIGGKEYKVQSVILGEKIMKPENPYRTGANFEKWVDKNGEEYDFNTGIDKYTELYAKFSSGGDAMLLPGQEFNQIIKRLAGNNNTATYNTNNTSIKQILQTGDILPGVKTGVISLPYSENEVVVQFTGGILYYVTQAEVVYMNPDSSYMFAYMNSLENVDIDSWDTRRVTYMGHMFEYCQNLTKLDTSKWDTSNVTNMASMFSNCFELITLDASKWDTSSVTNMSSMFYGCSSLETIYVGTGFVTMQVTSSDSMFYLDKKLIGGNGNRYNKEKVNKIYAVKDKPGQKGYFTSPEEITLKFMIGGKEYKIQSVGLGEKIIKPENPYRTGANFEKWVDKNGEEYDFNTGIDKYTELYAKFSSGGDAVLLPGQEFNQIIKRLAGQTTATYSTSNRTIKQILQTGGILPGVKTGVISSPYSEKEIIARFAGGVLYYTTEAGKIYMNPESNYMFYNMGGLTGLNLSNWDTSRVINMEWMFYRCYNLATLDLSNWDTSNVTDMGFMFDYNQSLSELDLSGWNTSNVTDMSEMFFRCYNLTDLNIGSWNTANVVNMSHMFGDCEKLTELDIGKWDTSNVTDMSWIFSSCNKLTELDISDRDTSSVTNMDGVFASCSSLTGLNLRGWDTSNVRSMRQIFASCSSLIELDLSSWNTSKVYDMYYMFSNCQNLTNLNLSNWDTSNVTSMLYMFGGCSSLIKLDLSSWNTSKVYDMQYAFYNCSNLKTIYANPQFTTESTSYFDEMFTNAVNIVGGNGTTYDENHVDGEYARIDGRNGLSGYFTSIITLNFDSDGGTLVDSQTFKAGLTGTKPTDPTKTGNTFLGWYTSDDLEFDFNQPLFESIQLYAKWGVNQYTITFDTDGGTIIPPITADYGTTITAPSNPTKNGYKFVGWDRAIPSTMPAENLIIKAKWEKNGSSGGGGGGGGGTTKPDTSKEDNTQTETTEQTTQNEEQKPQDSSEQVPQNDKQDTKDSSEQTSQSDNNKQGDSSTKASEGHTYSQESQQAYEFAHENGITTKSTIESAQMNGKLTRIAMAKMLSQYAINVLGKTPDTTQNIKFNDVSDKRNADYDNGVTLAYQLGIMGQNMKDNNFRPDDEVTRAEFATALSRLLYSTSDGEYKSTAKYYIHHMEKLKEEGIITKDDPKMKELRGYVMIMIMRSAK